MLFKRVIRTSHQLKQSFHTFRQHHKRNYKNIEERISKIVSGINYHRDLIKCKNQQNNYYEDLNQKTVTQYLMRKNQYNHSQKLTEQLKEIQHMYQSSEISKSDQIKLVKWKSFLLQLQAKCLILTNKQSH